MGRNSSGKSTLLEHAGREHGGRPRLCAGERSGPPVLPGRRSGSPCRVGAPRPWSPALRRERPRRVSCGRQGVRSPGGDDRPHAGAGAARCPSDRHPRDLSEGQRLGLALAIVVARPPALLLLDEPTRGLDYPSKDRLIHVLRGLARDGRAIVLATHDVELAARVADRAVVLADGQFITDGPARQVVCHSPIFAPQVAKVLAPEEWLTVDEVRQALEGAVPA